MKSKRTFPNGRRRLWFVALSVAGLILLLPFLAGVAALEVDHAIARVRFDGLNSESETTRLREAADGIVAHRRSRVGPAGATLTNVWKAELEFGAASLTEAAIRLAEWQDQFPAGLEITVEKLMYQPLRLHRPGRGAIVLGPTRTLTGAELAPSSSPARAGNAGNAHPRAEPSE